MRVGTHVCRCAAEAWFVINSYASVVRIRCTVHASEQCTQANMCTATAVAQTISNTRAMLGANVLLLPVTTLPPYHHVSTCMLLVPHTPVHRDMARDNATISAITDEVLFEGRGDSRRERNNWIGWYSLGVPRKLGEVWESGDDGSATHHAKKEAYDTLPLKGLRLEDDSGRVVDYELSQAFAGQTLLAIVQSCKPRFLANDNSVKWRSGWCDNVATVVSSNNIPTGLHTVLRIAVGDGSNDGDDWALLMPMTGNGKGDYSGSRTWAFGGEGRANNGYTGTVRIIGITAPSSTTTTTTTTIATTTTTIARQSTKGTDTAALLVYVVCLHPRTNAAPPPTHTHTDTHTHTHTHCVRQRRQHLLPYLPVFTPNTHYAARPNQHTFIRSTSRL